MTVVLPPAGSLSSDVDISLISRRVRFVETARFGCSRGGACYADSDFLASYIWGKACMKDSDIRPIAAVFKDATKEREFRAAEHSTNAVRLTIVVSLMVPVSLVFIWNDYLFFGIAPLFFTLLATRFAFVLASAGLLFWVWRRKSFALLPVWLLLSVSLVIAVDLTRPPAHTTGAILNMIFILTIYTVMPASLFVRLFFCTVFAAAEGFILFCFRSGLSVPDMTVLRVTFVLTNVLGIFFAWSSEIRSRKRFNALLRERGLKQALEERAEELEQANTALDSFSRAVAHDLRSPLSGLVGLADLIQMESDEHPDRYANIQGYVSGLSTTAYQMVGIVDSLLLLARIRRSDDLEIGPVDLSHVLSEVQMRLKPEIERFKGRLFISPCQLIAAGYEPWLHEVFANLIGNALKYGGESPEVEVHAKQEDDWVVLAVSDRGRGVPDAEKEMIFSEFFRSGGHTRDGLGIGLSIAARAAQRMGGSLRVEDRAGGGSIFVLTLAAA